MDKRKLSRRSEGSDPGTNSSLVTLETLHQLAASYFIDRDSTLRRLHHIQIASTAIKVRLRSDYYCILLFWFLLLKCFSLYLLSTLSKTNVFWKYVFLTFYCLYIQFMDFHFFSLENRATVFQSQMQLQYILAMKLFWVLNWIYLFYKAYAVTALFLRLIIL